MGNGFPVRSLFGYDGLGKHLSPFLLLDHAAPTRFEPAAQPREARGLGDRRGDQAQGRALIGGDRDSCPRGRDIGPGHGDEVHARRDRRGDRRRP